MRPFLLFVSLFSITVCTAQSTFVIGTYASDGYYPNKTRVIFDISNKTKVVFNEDSTFEYTSNQHPVFVFDREPFSERGKWTISGDTIILNPQFSPRPAIEIDFKEEAIPGDTGLTLTFNHVKRYFDRNDNPVIYDTVNIKRLDYAFNAWKKKNIRRVSENLTVSCLFAGYIPQEIITDKRTIVFPRPAEELKSIFIGCYEAQGTKEHKISNPQSTRLTYTVYSNYYRNSATFRQAKMLIKNSFSLYTRQYPDGQFDKDKYTEYKLTRVQR